MDLCRGLITIASLFLLLFHERVDAATIATKLPPKIIRGATSPIEFTAANVADLLKRLRKEQDTCKLPPKKRPSICHHQKFLAAMETLMESFLSQQAKLDRLAGRVVFLDEENTDLKTSIKAQREPAEYTEKKVCYKPEFLKSIMLENGITENGNSIFSKMPVPGAEGVCWSNSKKKQEATFNLCNYPLAIDIRSKGGSDLLPTIMEKEYLFSLNGCDLLSVHAKTQDVHGNTETLISYNQCLEQWNKRTADAAMTEAQSKHMEETIGFCFREHLLPPREEPKGSAKLQPKRPASPPRPSPRPNQDSTSLSLDPNE